MIFLFLCLTSHSLTHSRSIHIATNGNASFFLMAGSYSIVHMYHIFLSIFCRWTFHLLPSLGYCKQCCNGYLGACVLLDHVFLLIYSQEWDCKIISLKKQESSRKKNTYFCFIDYAKAFDCVDHNKLWKILKEMGIPDHLTCFLRNLYAGHQATVRTGHGTTEWFQIGKGVRQDCILSLCLFNLYVAYIAEVQPQLIQGIRRRDGIDKLI